MSLSTRRAILSILIFLFIIVVTALIFYSNGWHVDLETFRIDKLGGLYISETIPRDVLIKMEKAHIELNPGILTNGTFIANLFPKNYALEVHKDGYQTWTKEFTVEASKVTKTYPIILMPTQASTTLIASHVIETWIGPAAEAWKNTNNNLFINNEAAVGNEVIAWSSDGSYAITKTQRNQFFLINIAEHNTATNLSLLLQNLNREKVITALFHPVSATTLIISTNAGLYTLSSENFSLVRLDNKPVSHLISVGNAILWKSGDQVKTSDPASIKPEIAILKDKLLSQDNLVATLSPDKKKLAISYDFEPGKIRVYFLEENEVYKKHAGDFNIIDTGIPLVHPQFAWHESSAYLFIQKEDSLVFAEIDNRMPMNFQTVATHIHSFGYGADRNELYFFASSSLYKAEL